MPKSKIYLLDTHVWIWLLSGNKHLQKSNSFKYILKASKYSGLNISIISIWELAMLEAKARIILSTEINSWIEKALKAPGLKLVPISPSILIDSTRLPGFFRGDPADRILIATARYLQCPVITADKSILKYSLKGFVRTVKV